MGHKAAIGHLVPDVTLAKASRNAIETVSFRDVMGDRKGLVLGVPGAFTPICTTEHVPDFVRNVARLRRVGFERLVCIAPNDPFTLHAWRQLVDPQEELIFLSDGNRDFARALDLHAKHPDYYLGHSNRRYLLLVDKLKITRLSVEPTVDLITCTRSCDATANGASEAAPARA
jgi:peroxiredoxin